MASMPARVARLRTLARAQMLSIPSARICFRFSARAAIIVWAGVQGVSGPSLIFLRYCFRSK